MKGFLVGIIFSLAVIPQWAIANDKKPKISPTDALRARARQKPNPNDNPVVPMPATNPDGSQVTMPSHMRPTPYSSTTRKSNPGQPKPTIHTPKTPIDLTKEPPIPDDATQRIAAVPPLPPTLPPTGKQTAPKGKPNLPPPPPRMPPKK